jgi:glycosyltransferase involved in cell wall biosynthesis
LVHALVAAAADTVFHFHGSFIFEFSAAAKILNRRSMKYVVTTHGGYAPGALRKNAVLKWIYFRAFERRFLKDASGVHLVGETEWRNLGLWEPSLRRFLLPNAESLTEVHKIDPPVGSADRPVFGFCGRLDSYNKGLDVLLEGFALHREARRPGVLWVVGDGPDREWLVDEVGKRGMERVVRLWGARFGDDKLRILSGVDAFVYPSRFEGFPMGVLEAAALALPLIVTEETNVAAYVRKYRAGIVLPEASGAAVCEAMAQIADAQRDGALAPFREGARRMIVEELNWPAVAARLRREYEAR